MRGVGGPLLCIGDLLSDVGEEDDDFTKNPEEHLLQSPSSTSSSSVSILDPTIDLVHMFQEHYDRLNEALAGTDHSWTALTLKLCTAVETANKLIQSTDSNAELLSEKVEELQKIVKKGDAAVAAAKTINFSLSQKEGPHTMKK